MKKILVAICGGIAAYKSLILIRMLIAKGYDIEVICTPNATKFITTLSLQALTNKHIWVEEWDSAASNNMAHINLTRNIDAVIIAPATASTIAKLANGIADNLLCSTILACPQKVPIFIAPSMNVEMWHNKATMRNINQLKTDGMRIINPNSGMQACGENGLGRMQEPENIVSVIQDYFLLADIIQQHENIDKYYANKHIVITAGATREYIDPVRYISNASSGKMAVNLAYIAALCGAKISFVYANIDNDVLHCLKNISNTDNINFIKTTNAQSMYDATLNIMHSNQSVDIFIGIAAVADWTPVNVSEHKNKKNVLQENNSNINIELTKTKDIISAISEIKKIKDTTDTKNNNICCVGFAAETKNIEQYAKEKLIRKNLDLIIANNANVFGADENKVCIISKYSTKNLELMHKKYVSIAILAEVKDLVL
jgi:phosphopantothenoylcysteine decarboxylase / phosphopantothenate---cysteine ligase